MRLRRLHPIPLFSFDEGLDIFREFVDQALPRFLAGPGDVWAEQHFDAHVGREQRMRKRRRFLLQDIGGVARERLALQGMGNRQLIHHRAAREIDEMGRGFHEAQSLRIDEVMRFFGQRAMDRHEIAAPQQLWQRIADRRFRILGLREARDADLHAKAPRQLRHAASNLAITDDA